MLDICGTIDLVFTQEVWTWKTIYSHRCLDNWWMNTQFSGNGPMGCVIIKPLGIQETDSQETQFLSGQTESN